MTWVYRSNTIQRERTMCEACCSKKVFDAHWVWRGFSRPPCRRQILLSTECDLIQSSFLLQLLQKSPTVGLYILHVRKPLDRENLRNWLTLGFSKISRATGFSISIAVPEKVVAAVGRARLLALFLCCRWGFTIKQTEVQTGYPTDFSCEAWFGNDLCRCCFWQWC